MSRWTKDAVPFLEDAEAVRHLPLPWWACSSLLWMAFLFLTILVWASLASVDIIVDAQGKLVSDHPTIVMKPLERTVIKELHVQVGDRVHSGQVLVTFDPVFSQAEQEKLLQEVQAQEALLQRLKAELAGRAYNPEETTEASIQADIYLKRQNYYAAKEEYFRREIERLSRSRTSMQKNIAVQHERLKGYQDIENMLLRASRSQAVSPRDLKEAQLSRMQLEADTGDKENNLLVLDSELMAKKAEQKAFEVDWRIAIAQELVKTRSALNKARKELEKACQMRSYVDLRAPEDAVVHDISPMSTGSAVREAEALMSLVPLGGKLEVEAEIKAEDIGKIRTGDKVRIKVGAFPFQKYGTLSGTIRVISEDAFTRQPGEAVQPGTSGAFYRARIAITGAEKEKFRLMERLIPGMEVQAEISVGERRIIEYLIHPIIKSLDEAIREP